MKKIRLFTGRKTEEPQKEQENLLTADELLDVMIEDYTGLKQKEIADVRRGRITREAFLRAAQAHMKKTYGDKAGEQTLEQALHRFEQYIFGYYRLQELISDKDISDIRVVAYDCIRHKRKGVRSLSPVTFQSKEEYGRFVDFVAAKNQINVSNLNAIQTFTDKKSHQDFILRFTVCMPLLTGTDSPYLHIRKIARNFPELSELVEAGMLTEEMGWYLTLRAKQGSMFICGKSGAGKTILLNAIKEAAIPSDKSCLVIQENEELTTKSHPEMMFMHPVVNRGESRVAYTLDEISTAALLMDFDYFIIGEIKGSEALDLLNASFTGHICFATGHGESAENALDKVVVNAKKKSDLSRTELLKMLLSFQTVVFLKDFKVDQVAEVAGFSDLRQEILYRKIGTQELKADRKEWESISERTLYDTDQ